MKETSIKCYLCDSEAKEWDAPDTSRNLVVECSSCKPYLLTEVTRQFITHRPDGDELLDEKAKEKLVLYVQKTYELTGEPVMLTTDVIEYVTE